MRKRLVVQVSSVSRSSEKVLTLRGPASVIDGDTIVVAGERIRLHGIDAPELEQIRF
jgi:endonuclease YncB( thermonuclease family)